MTIVSSVLIFASVLCFERLEPLERFERLERPLRSFLLQLPRNAVIDQIIGFKFGKLRISLGKKLQCALYPLFRRDNAAIVKQPYPGVEIFAAIRRSETQPLPQAADDCRLIALVLNEPV